MFSSILSELTGKLDKRFLMNVFFPTLLFMGLLIYLNYIEDASAELDIWNGLPEEVQAVDIIIFLFLVAFISYILEGRMAYFLRLYEGYWEDNRILKKFSPAKKSKHRLEQRIIYLKISFLNFEQDLLDEMLDVARLKLELSKLDIEKESPNKNAQDIEKISKSKDDTLDALDDVADKFKNVHQKTLIPANTRLDEALEAIKSIFSQIIPDLDKAEKILRRDNGIESSLEKARKDSKEASKKFDKIKSDILNLFYKIKPSMSGPTAAYKAANAIENSRISVTELKSSLQSLSSRPMIIESWLKEANRKIMSLENDLPKYSQENDEYEFTNSIISKSKDINVKIKSIEDDLKAIEDGFTFVESLPKVIEEHLNRASNSLKEAKEAISGVIIPEILKRDPNQNLDERAYFSLPSTTLEIKRQKDEAFSQAGRLDEIAYYNFPQPGEIMPTRLGNILKSAEMYPKERYGADAVFLWPKLYPLLSSERSTTLADARGALDFMVLISLLSFAFSILGSFILLRESAEPIEFLIAFLGPLAIGWIAYQGAIEAAIKYSDMIRSTFDLYRDKLIKEMDLKSPASLEEERAFWDDLGQWLYRNAPSSKIIYIQDSAKKETK